MSKQRNLVLLMVILIVVLVLVVTATFTPALPWLKGTLLPIVETPQPAVPPAQSPQPTAPPQPTEPPQPVEISPPENTIILSEEKLQSKLDELISTANQSGTANIEYIRVKLEQDRMLVSTRGEARGYHVETEDLEVRFEEKTVFVSGKVSAFGLSPTVNIEAEINCESGKPSVEVKKFSPGLPLMVLGLSKDKISGLINDAIEAAGIEVPVDLESISIEDGKLIMVYK